MVFIDERGRLFGRLNVIDAALIVVLLVGLSVAYTAVRLFRPRPPHILSVAPTSQLVGPTPRLTLYGQDFRPYLRVFVNPSGTPYSLVEQRREDTEGRVYVENPDVLQLELPAKLLAGRYDVYLYDETREVARLPAAFELRAPAEPETQLLTIQVRAIVDSSLVGFVRRGDQEAVARESGWPVAELSRVQPMVDWSAWPQRVLLLEVRVPATRTKDGLVLAGQEVIRAGAPFTFETTRYVVHGQIQPVIQPVWGP